MPKPPFQTNTGLGFGLGLINYWESDQSTTEYADNEGNIGATRNLYCLWKDRLLFPRAMLGWAQVGANGGQIIMSRSLPAVHPDRPKLYAVKCDMVGGKGVPQYEPDTGMQAFNKTAYAEGSLENRGDGFAYFRVEYQYVPWDVLSDAEIGGHEERRFVERWETFSSQVVTLPGGCFKFVSAPDRDIPEGIPKLLLGGELHLKWRGVPSSDGQVPSGLRANMKSCTNRVNSTEFMGYDPGTLLCLDPQIERKRNITGIDTLDIEYVFGIREPETTDGIGGWNTVFRKDLTAGPDFDYVEASDGTGRGIYLEALSFEPLFLFNQIPNDP